MILIYFYNCDTVLCRLEASRGEYTPSPLFRLNLQVLGVSMKKTICSVEGCNNKSRSLGYCNKHYQTFHVYGDPLHKVKEKQNIHSSTCSVPFCNNPYRCKGYCEKHYTRYLKYGDPCICKIEKHGMEKSQEYKTWSSMKDRCTNKNNHNYKYYGQRGVVVCKRWIDSFVNFYKDMGEKPFPKAQIDRINNNGNYEPSNCRWVNCAKNNRNRSITKLSSADVQEIRELQNDYSVKYLASKYNISKSHMRRIIKNKAWREYAEQDI